MPEWIDQLKAVGADRRRVGEPVAGRAGVPGDVTDQHVRTRHAGVQEHVGAKVVVELLRDDVDGVADEGDEVAVLRAERDVNTSRESFTATEIVEVGRSIEAIERPEARVR